MEGGNFIAGKVAVPRSVTPAKAGEVFPLLVWVMAKVRKSASLRKVLV